MKIPIKIAAISQKSSGKSLALGNIFDGMPATVKRSISDNDDNTKTITTFTANARLSGHELGYKLITSAEDVQGLDIIGIDTAAGTTDELGRNKIYKGVDFVLVVGKPFAQEWTTIINTINEFSSAFAGEEDKKSTVKQNQKPKLIICITDVKNSADYEKKAREINNLVAVNDGYILTNYIPHIPLQPQMFEAGISAARALTVADIEKMDLDLTDDQKESTLKAYACIAQKIRATSKELLEVMGVSK